jgi:hypothetical protein
VRLRHLSSMRVPDPLCGNIFHRSRRTVTRWEQ